MNRSTSVKSSVLRWKRLPGASEEEEEIMLLGAAAHAQREERDS